MYCHPERRHSG